MKIEVKYLQGAHFRYSHEATAYEYADIETAFEYVAVLAIEAKPLTRITKGSQGQPVHEKYFKKCEEYCQDLFDHLNRKGGIEPEDEWVIDLFGLRSMSVGDLVVFTMFTTEQLAPCRKFVCCAVGWKELF